MKTSELPLTGQFFEEQNAGDARCRLHLIRGIRFFPPSRGVAKSSEKSREIHEILWTKRRSLLNLRRGSPSALSRAYAEDHSDSKRKLLKNPSVWLVHRGVLAGDRALAR